MAGMIEVRGLCKTFETKDAKVEALQDINLSIQAGDIYGIIGMSGAGKSTLVRCLNFLERPTAGTVEVEGKDLSSLSEKELRAKRRDIAMIFQHFNLLMQKNVIDNICFPLDIAGVPKKDARKRAEELLEIVGLTDKAKAYPSQLSGGQKQRVAIARALAANPKILLCDEATSALDPQTTQSILQLLRQINKEYGITIVIITHEMAVVKEMRGERDEENWKRELRENMEKAYAEAYRLGGVASGEHGIGTAKRHYFLRETPQENLTTMNRLKDALDPLHILNDQKAYIETKRRG